MSKSHRYNRSLTIKKVFLLIVLTGISSTISAQSTSCPTNSGNAWPKNSIVAVYLDSNLKPEQLTQFREAMRLWNIENSNNGSNVTFREALAGENPALNVQNGDLTRTDANGRTYAPGGETVKTPQSGPTNSANITFDLNGRSPNGIPAYSPTNAGYENIWLKVMLHELGHTMGLSELPINSGSCAGQTAGASVMNIICNPNDSSNNI